MNTQASPTPEPQTTMSPQRARHVGLWALGAVVALAAVGYGAYWFVDGRFYESTDDAYVNGDVVQVTSEVPGTVLSLKVDDTQRVNAGQPLLQLDPADASIAVANAEADLARAVRQVRGLFAQSKELHAQIEQREQAERTADSSRTAPFPPRSFRMRVMPSPPAARTSPRHASSWIRPSRRSTAPPSRTIRRCSRPPRPCATPSWPCTARSSPHP
jgi:hypothetical protein